MPNDRTLAPLFLGRGARFVEAGRWAQARGFSDELVLSQICWGLELALKAYLLARGSTDDHNRRAHRHDLIKASFAAQQLGLALGRPMEWLLADVGPFARRHAIPEALARRPDLLARHDALELAEDLVRRVRRSLMGHATRAQRPPPPCSSTPAERPIGIGLACDRLRRHPWPTLRTFCPPATPRPKS